jgi:hypothetical protein
MQNLTTAWMNGVTIYTTKPVRINDGHVGYPGQPWALTSISQVQFWRKDFAVCYGDGTAVDCLSVDLSDWDIPGILNGKPAKQCTREQIVAEVLAQLRRALPNGNTVARLDHPLVVRRPGHQRRRHAGRRQRRTIAHQHPVVVVGPPRRHHGRSQPVPRRRLRTQ